MINWYQFSALANIVLCLTLLTSSIAIAVPVVRLRLFREKKLATGAAVLLLAIGVSRGLVAVHYLFPGVTRAAGAVTFWWEAVWNVLAAATGIYFLSLHRYFGQLLLGAQSFENLIARQLEEEPEGLAAESLGRVAAESERDAGAAMLRSIVTNNQAAIYVKDLSGRYLLGNPKYAEIMGRSEADFLGLTDDIVGSFVAERRRADDITARGGLFRMDESNDLFSDGRRYYESVKFPLYDAEGNIYAVAGSSLDVTHERRAKAEVEASRDLALAGSAAKSAFLATMSHEIRTPMNAVIGMTDLLLDTDLNAIQLEFVDTVRVSGDALLSVINDILDFSKIESGELRIEKESFHLREQVEGCLDLVIADATEKGLELICYVDDSCPTHVVGDAVRLRQIIVNLLSNAVKFTLSGEILLSVSAMPTEDARLRLVATVTDTGIGISTDGVAHLFESFSQVDASTTRVYGGTGLGLAITQRLAEAMDGVVSVDSTPGVGSTFTAHLILDPASTEEAPTATPTVDLVGRSVLVVEHNLTVLEILGRQLTSLGLRCTSVAEAAEALALFRGGSTYDLVMVDQQLPRLDGVQLTALIKDLPHATDVPVVLLSSIGSRQVSGAAFAAVLAKPVKTASLLRALTSALTGEAGYDLAVRPSALDPSVLPLRILLAEDNPVNQRVAQLMLAKLGHQVDTVDNGAAAVSSISAKPYDVILMDVQMPEMDGLEATRRIRAQIPLPQQPHIIAMTASALAEDHDACADAGMDSFLPKPVRAVELKDMLTRVAEARARPPAPAGSAEDADGQGRSSIRQSVLDELARQLDDETGQMVGDLISRYLRDSRGQMSTLTQAAEVRDAPTVLRLAHNLRSSSDLLGAVPLVGLLEETERTARANPDRLSEYGQLLEDEYCRVAQRLGQLREQPSG